MDFIIVHHVVNICYFGIGAYTFGVACHIVCHRAVKEVCMMMFHTSSDISVCNNSFNMSFLDGDEQAEASVRHGNKGFSHIGVFVDDRQVFCLHHIACPCKEFTAKASPGVEKCEVMSLESPCHHKRTCQGVAHGQGSGSAACGCQV